MCSSTEKAYVILVSSCIIDVVPLLSHHVIFNFLFSSLMQRQEHAFSKWILHLCLWEIVLLNSNTSVVKTMTQHGHVIPLWSYFVPGPKIGGNTSHLCSD